MPVQPDTASPRAPTGLRRSALALAGASGLEYLVQLAIPVILVRTLDPESFSQYRLLWLMASTALALAPAFMPQSLFYFLARVEAGERRVYIANVLAYLTVAGIIAGIAFSGWNPMLPHLAMLLYDTTRSLSSVFVGLWVLAAILDTLPTADGRPVWQAKATVTLALLRAILLVLAAVLGANMFWLAIAMLVVGATRLGTAALYIVTYHGRGAMLRMRPSLLKTQLAYALPFALGNAMFLLRVQAGEWVAAAMFAPALYASFSIAAVVLPIATLIRQPVHNAMMPYLNAAHARGDLEEFARLVAKSNGAAGLLLFPVAGGMMVAAAQLVEIVYTERYQAAAPVMQLYLCIMMMNAFALGHVLPALNKGVFATVNGAVCLLLSVGLSALGARYGGLPGAALGSVLTFGASEAASLLVVARALHVAPARLLAWQAMAVTAAATLAAMIAATAIESYLRGPAILLLMSKAVLYACVFILCFFVLGGKRHLSLLKRR